MAKIEISNAEKIYPGNITALTGIDLVIEDGELMVLVGPSGCGKSTLLRMIAGLESITSGTVTLDRKVINTVEPAARDIAMVFQNYALYPHMTVRANLEYGLRNRGVPREEREVLITEAARILEIADYLDRKPGALSGGQRQRVAMGRAIVRKPRAFLFDEPLSNLDAKLRGQMRVEIRRLQKRLNTTSIYVTHDQLEAMTLADRLAVMNGGRIEQVGAPHELYARPATAFVARFIGSPGMNVFDTAELQATGAVLPGAVPSGCLLGFRPEDVCLEPFDEPGVTLSGEVEGAELLGADGLLYVNFPGCQTSAIARFQSGGKRREEGETVMLHLPLDALHFFDMSDGKRIPQSCPSAASMAGMPWIRTRSVPSPPSV